MERGTWEVGSGKFFIYIPCCLIIVRNQQHSFCVFSHVSRANSSVFQKNYAVRFISPCRTCRECRVKRFGCFSYIPCCLIIVRNQQHSFCVFSHVSRANSSVFQKNYAVRFILPCRTCRKCRVKRFGCFSYIPCC